LVKIQAFGSIAKLLGSQKTIGFLKLVCQTAFLTFKTGIESRINFLKSVKKQGFHNLTGYPAIFHRYYRYLTQESVY